MVNPYSSARSTVASTSPSVEKTGSVMGWVSFGICLCTLIVCAAIAIVLISQALRLSSESAGLPAKFASSGSSMIRASWIGGIIAAIAAAANAVSLIWVWKKRWAVSLAIGGVSWIALIAVAIAFKPV